MREKVRARGREYVCMSASVCVYVREERRKGRKERVGGGIRTMSHTVTGMQNLVLPSLRVPRASIVFLDDRTVDSVRLCGFGWL